MELVRVDRREVLLGPQARDVDGVLAVGEDLLVLARFGLALAPRVRRTLREPRGAALVVLALVALGRRERRDELLVLGLRYFMGSLGVLTMLSGPLKSRPTSHGHSFAFLAL